MEQGRGKVSEISEKAGLSQGCVSYHLKLFLRQKIVSYKQTGRAALWMLTRYGQEKLFA